MYKIQILFAVVLIGLWFFCIVKLGVVVWKRIVKKRAKPDHSFILYKDYSQIRESTSMTITEAVVIDKKAEALIVKESAENQTVQKEKRPLPAVLNFEDYF